MAFYCMRNSTQECDGCMACKPSPSYYCPICGKEVYEAVFLDNSGSVIGCDNCVEIKDPHEVLDDETY